MRVKQADVAGYFYPDDAGQLQYMLDEALQKVPETNEPCPKAIIAPHAGYVYSGDVAAYAYCVFKKYAKQIKRVILLGPAHRFPLRSLAICNVDEFATPLGNIPVDTDYVKTLNNLPGIDDLKKPFQGEHCLEVQLPFLQTVLDDFSIIPVIVGAVSPEKVAAFLQKVWGGKETLIVISSDLSHYHPYDHAQKIDAATSKGILEYNLESVRPETACGSRGINGLLTVAQHRHMTCQLLDLRNSGDTAGDKSRVVGYASYHFFENPEVLAFTDLARQSIAYGLKHQKIMSVGDQYFSEKLNNIKACFVTLEINGQLRGCIGSLTATKRLGEDIIDNAYNAAFKDSRFKPLSEEEFKQCDIHVSVLSKPTAMVFQSEENLLEQIEPGVDGLILEAPGHRGTFLPSVWEQIPEPRDFLNALKQKAGLAPDFWSDDIKMYRYHADIY